MTALLAGLALAQASLEVGMDAPDFTLRDQTGAARSLHDYRGRTVVLMFYPKDETSGCSCQARAARDVAPAFTSKNVVVLSVNGDDVASHAAFARKEGLNYPLLADPEKTVLRRYGVLGENGLARRVTFVIDGRGRISGIDRKVDESFSRAGGELKTSHLTDIGQFVSDWRPEVGSQVPNFWLADAEGRTVEIRPSGRVASVLLFLSEDETSRRYLPLLGETANSPAYAKVAFFALDPNHGGRTLPPVEARGDLAWTTDPLGSTLPRFGVTHTPSAWIFDAKGWVRYAGPLDAPEGTREGRANLFRQALLSTLNGRPASRFALPQFGTPVSGAESAKASEN